MSFFGRAAEIAKIGTLLENGARLITIVGPGGAGKTRLARRAAPEARVVEVAPRFEVEPLSGVIILDGFEPVMSEASKVARWIRETTASFLITSREPLHLAEEERIEIS